ncbi:MAG: discoidin domain-containing protein [Planctomycetota bacterium]
MRRKLIYLTCSVLALITSGSVEAEPFSLGAVEDITLGNDARYGPDSSSNGSGLEARDIPSRRHVAFISYDISALTSEGQFSNVSFSHFSHDQHGETNVYGVIESLDLLEVESLTWNTAPGVQNNPTPALDSPIELDFADLTDVLLTFSGPGQTGVRFSTDTSQALADFLNSDTDGIVTFLFTASAENNQLIVRSMEHAEGGSFLEGELSPIIGIALNPNPVDEATNVIRDVVLSWTPGQFADKHNVYLGTNFDDVNNADSGSPQLVGPPDYTVYKGSVWSFTTEPFAYPIDNITATASSSDAAKGPENTVNGSGLDDSGLLHDKVGEDNMWLSGIAGPQPTWIEFEFDKVYKLYQMWVWNSNTSLEPVLGLGFKDASIEYSLNGIDYTTLETTHEFARAPGTANYAHNTTIDFGGVAAKYVKLTANSNWGGILNQYGLSEVRFFYIPVHARNSYPDSGATGVVPDVVLSWRTGREAATHDVYFGNDEQAVIDATVPVATVAETSYGPLSLDLSNTYYWKVNEVNEAEIPTTWEGNLWSFTTRDFLIVDDFESYNDLNPEDPESNRIFNVWIDGYEQPTNGSIVGHDAAPFAEQTIVHSGKQSMPLSYSNR